MVANWFGTGGEKLPLIPQRGVPERSCLRKAIFESGSACGSNLEICKLQIHSIFS